MAIAPNGHLLQSRWAICEEADVMRVLFSAMFVYLCSVCVGFGALRKLLSERPIVRGIAVPGMPYGSPGMGDDLTVRYDVFAFGGKAGDGEVLYRAGE